jgi:hypothetical protein
LYEYDTLRRGNRLWVLENRVLRKKFGSKGRLGNELHNRERRVFKSLPYYI